jgi:transposase
VDGSVDEENLEALNVGEDYRKEAEVLLRAKARCAESIKEVEMLVLERVDERPDYERLLQIPGIGRILAMTILLESGDFARFPSCADYASYCRTVRSRKISNGKNKGRNNGRNGNPHLAWAFAEAAVFTQRFDPVAKAWFERKAKRRNRQVAYKALACKLSKAVWHVMNGNAYDSRRLFM